MVDLPTNFEAAYMVIIQQLGCENSDVESITRQMKKDFDTGATPSKTTTYLKRMTEKGLVVRIPDLEAISRKEQCINRYRLTPAGKTDLDKIVVMWKLVTRYNSSSDPILPTPAQFNIDDVVIHRKNQDAYRIVILPDIGIIEETGEPAYGYVKQNGSDKRIFFRSQRKMEDGRFTLSMEHSKP